MLEPETKCEETNRKKKKAIHHQSRFITQWSFYKQDC